MPKNSNLLLGELWNLPEKPESVIEFEALKKEGKAKIREVPEWSEIAKYYDRVNEVIQHNVGEHAWRQQIGYEPRGSVEYVKGTFVQPLRESVPKDEQWELGPDDFWHGPQCPYRVSNYKKLTCDCHRGRRPIRVRKK
jgi:hypothetical protein